MITQLDFSDLPIAPEESRSLKAWSDAGPLVVAIQCFREPPTPPHLTACQECGSYRIQSGQEVTIIASAMFQAVSGYMIVTVKDAAGDLREIRLDVAKQGGEEAYA